MEGIHHIKAAWHSFPPLLSRSNFATPVCRDSAYASDEVSDAASVATSFTAVTNTSSQVPEIGIPIPQGPRSILKKAPLDAEATDIRDFESGYESDDSESEFAEQLEFSVSAEQESDTDVPVDDIFDCELSSEAPLDQDDSCAEDDDGETDEIDFDDSHITFENSVRFDTDVSYIEAPEVDDDECDEPEMTWHEIMERARGRLQMIDADGASDNASDGFIEDDWERNIPNGPEEHPRDMVELDKQLFIAYMNGIHGVPDNKYKALLQTRAQEIREGRVHCPFFESETFHGAYLDEVLNHVIGVFRNVVLRDEFEELVRLCEAKVALEQSDVSPQELGRHTKDFLDKIERLLLERLAEGKVTIGKDELSFFAGGIAYALENWGVYTYDDVTTDKQVS
ncbi:hypothetical protein T310_6110 [Rasamsonia emersonii CBS 393.64]|uniref:Uncharacterized protein n=1 Tax=Rasamsonia emersonii (strain ATCC 16479 / CBS 393.64 / IMI 116815) TaxID=1408163 RepID=A0A0F4YPY3_RASE3|nr:hypothetical protein T310_6110 [Rasamsonia emersonii CBS 393.64]KKA19911.1 hypothetical protein T310_6110 [Rasamsonia emersonii CBS 393.64]